MQTAQPTPISERLHIGIFGRCNSGKSSLLNAITGQKAAIVSPLPGTTTDIVRKTMELNGVGPVVIIDTPGIDDTSILGQERIKQTRLAMDMTDIAIVIFDPDTENHNEELQLLSLFRQRNTPSIVVINKCETIEGSSSISSDIHRLTNQIPILISTYTSAGIEQLLNRIAASVSHDEQTITAGLCQAGDTVVLVMPQDKSAPKGRLIQPQVQTLRELLDKECISICTTPERLQETLNSLSHPPHLIITDSQAFNIAYRLKPAESLLTSFSILMARYKGDIKTLAEGAHRLLTLSPNSHILIAEACSHIPQNEDIGRVKLPKMLRQHFGSDIHIEIVAGKDFPDDLSNYDLVIHCGACMFNRQIMMSRINKATTHHTPITNYGMAIAALQGILDKVSY